VLLWARLWCCRHFLVPSPCYYHYYYFLFCSDSKNNPNSVEAVVFVVSPPPKQIKHPRSFRHISVVGTRVPSSFSVLMPVPSLVHTTIGYNLPFVRRYHRGRGWWWGWWWLERETRILQGRYPSTTDGAQRRVVVMVVSTLILMSQVGRIEVVVVVYERGRCDGPCRWIWRISEEVFVPRFH